MNNPNLTPALPIDPAVLTQVVRGTLNSDAAEVAQWQAQPARVSRGSATAGVYRLSGTARLGAETLPWAAILKIIQPAASDFNPATRDENHPIYWKREVLIYQSGLLADLPGGISAPRCLALEARPEDVCWLWLEAVQDDYEMRWPLAQYRRAAAALGRFNGAYLAGCPIPDQPWLGQPGTMPGLLNAFIFMHDLVRDEAAWRHPLVQAAFPIPVAERLDRLWSERQPLMNALERLPHTFCHKDAFHGNMFATQGEDNSPRLTLIDWAYTGRGELGLDIADLFGASYQTCRVASTDLKAYDKAIFGNYLTGLREAGWHGDARLARFGFTAAVSLKYGGLLLWLGDLDDPQRYAIWEEMSDQPIARFIQYQAELVYYLLDLLDEARGLLPVV